MKKSLKVIASAAMAFSMFASVAMADTTAATTTTTSATATAAAKTSKDFTDLANVDAGLKAKIDALLAKGWFEGVSDTEFGINQNMTRAQAAKLVDEIFGVTVDTSVTTSSFSDVVASDAANGWAIPYIEAAKKAGLIDGVTDTTFVPGDNVTLGQLATLLVKGMGKTVDQTGSPWYADAVKQAVALNILPANTDGSVAATRADLVSASFGADAANQATKKASVTDAKATGVQKVTVDFNKAVDASKATLTLKKGTVTINTTAAFAADNKSAVLTLTDTKINAGDYTVTLGGLDASAIDTATATFTAQDEQVAKIDFVSTGTTLARSTKAKVQIKATNQYGEDASFSAGQYTAIASTGTASVTKDANGNLFVGLDTFTNTIANVSSASITVYDNNHNATASKVFTIGDVPYVTKVELGDATYSNGKGNLSASGDKAVFALKMYDQYGQAVAKASDVSVAPTAFVTPYDSSVTAVVADDNGDGSDDLVVTLGANPQQAQDYTVSVFGGGSTATAKVSVNPSALATKVALGSINDTFAAGDKDKYIDILAYDAQGNQLSADDIVNNATNGRFTITTSSNLTTGADASVPASILDAKGQIVTAGPNKGKLHIATVGDKGTGFVSIGIYAVGAASSAQANVPISDARFPVSIKVSTDNPQKAILGATATGHFQLLDQYGSVITGLATPTVQDSNGAQVSYNVVASFSAPSSITVANGATPAKTLSSAVDPVTKAQTVNTLSLGDFSDQDWNFNTSAANVGDSAQVTFTLQKLDANGKVIDNGVSSITKKVTVINPANETLTYGLSTLGNVYAAIADGSYVTGTSDNAALLATPLHEQVTVTAKDAAGNSVAVPANIVSASTDNGSVAKTAVDTTAKTAYVVGNNAGTANVSVIFTDAKGASQQLTAPVTVKSDYPTVASIAADNNAASVSAGTTGSVDGLYAYDILKNLDVKDQYGEEYKNDNTNGPATNVIYNFDKYLGIRYLVSDVVGNGTVSVGANGLITQLAGSKIKSLTITAVAPNGKSVSTYVAVNQ